jgi:hypothetical protein
LKLSWKALKSGHGYEFQGSKVLGSAQPPAKKTAGQIEKETEVSYERFKGSGLNSTGFDI